MPSSAERWDYSLMRRRIRLEIGMHRRSIYVSRRATGRLILYGSEHKLAPGFWTIGEARLEGMRLRRAEIPMIDWAIEVEEEMVRLRELMADMARDRAAIERLREDLAALRGL